MSTGMEARTLGITGMTCNNCVNHVQKALLGTPGVTKAVVDLKKEKADVECAAATPQGALVSAVKEAGYGVREIAQSGPSWKFWQS